MYIYLLITIYFYFNKGKPMGKMATRQTAAELRETVKNCPYNRKTISAVLDIPYGRLTSMMCGFIPVDYSLCALIEDIEDYLPSVEKDFPQPVICEDRIIRIIRGDGIGKIEFKMHHVPHLILLLESIKKEYKL